MGTCLHLKGGASLPSQLFIAAVGIRANVKLAQDGGGADQSGDCGQFQDGNLCTGYLTRPAMLSPPSIPSQESLRPFLCGQPPMRQGQCAGKNMAGQSVDYSPMPMVNDIAFFGVHVISALASNTEDPEATIYEQRWDDEYRRAAVKDGRLLGLLAISSGEKAAGRLQEIPKGSLRRIRFSGVT